MLSHIKREYQAKVPKKRSDAEHVRLPATVPVTHSRATAVEYVNLGSSGTGRHHCDDPTENPNTETWVHETYNDVSCWGAQTGVPI